MLSVGCILLYAPHPVRLHGEPSAPVVITELHCRCVDAFDNTISTPEKHAFQVATVGEDGYVYTATGGTLEPKFAAVADSLKQATRTFRVA